jgi:hypothetical protein
MTMRPHLLPLLLGLVALALLLGAATAHAQPASAPAATARAPAAPTAEPGFKPLAPGESAAPPDALPAPAMVKIAYSLIWFAVVVFLVSLWRRHRRLVDDVAALQKRLERAGHDH